MLTYIEKKIDNWQDNYRKKIFYLKFLGIILLTMYKQQDKHIFLVSICHIQEVLVLVSCWFLVLQIGKIKTIHFVFLYNINSLSFFFVWRKNNWYHFVWPKMMLMMATFFSIVYNKTLFVIHIIDNKKKYWTLENNITTKIWLRLMITPDSLVGCLCA